MKLCDRALLLVPRVNASARTLSGIKSLGKAEEYKWRVDMSRVLFLLFSLILPACGGGGSGSSGSPNSTSYTIARGVAQKGPLQIGSTVTIAELDQNLNPTGKTFITEVKDSLGTFSLASSISTNLVLIVAEGFFMDENTGQFSSAPITLRGISDLSIESFAFG